MLSFRPVFWIAFRWSCSLCTYFSLLFNTCLLNNSSNPDSFSPITRIIFPLFHSWPLISHSVILHAFMIFLPLNVSWEAVDPKFSWIHLFTTNLHCLLLFSLFPSPHSFHVWNLHSLPSKLMHFSWRKENKKQEFSHFVFEHESVEREMQ